MDHVMNDLKNAIEMLPREKDVARVTRWSALAFKSRIALYEGTWRKYRNLPDADKYLQLAADAASTFISESGYSLYKEGTEPYRDLFLQRRRQTGRGHSGPHLQLRRTESLPQRAVQHPQLRSRFHAPFHEPLPHGRRFALHRKKRDTKRCPTPKRPPDATPVWHRPYSVRATSPKARSRSRRTT